MNWFTQLDSTGYSLRITLPGECIDDCSTPGQDAAEAVKYWVARLGFDADPAATRDYLEATGAWIADECELDDHATNLEMLLWLVACDLRDEYLGTEQLGGAQ